MAIKAVELVDPQTASLETDRETFKRTVFTAISDLTRNGKKSQRVRDLINKYHQIMTKAGRAFDADALRKLMTEFNTLKSAYKP